MLNHAMYLVVLMWCNSLGHTITANIAIETFSPQMNAIPCHPRTDNKHHSAVVCSALVISLQIHRAVNDGLNQSCWIQRKLVVWKGKRNSQDWEEIFFHESAILGNLNNEIEWILATLLVLYYPSISATCSADEERVCLRVLISLPKSRLTQTFCLDFNSLGPPPPRLLASSPAIAWPREILDWLAIQFALFKKFKASIGATQLKKQNARWRQEEISFNNQCKPLGHQ